VCGIAVLLRDEKMPPKTLCRMADAARHRGPDDSGEAYFRRGADGGWSEVDGGDGQWRLGLAHRRLSILDLSPRGHQPMQYRNRWWIVFNGEVYNFRELATELRRLGHEFVSRSDTEVVLAAYAEWGTECFRRFRGMWAAVIVDGWSGKIVVTRDRLGIKPLYVYRGSEGTAVVSEIKQLLEVPRFKARIDGAQVGAYLRTGYELPEKTFFEGVAPVAPGTWAELDGDTGQLGVAVSYWEPERVTVSIRGAEEAAEAFWEAFRESVRLHLRSDVPVGCALSGGLDSSSIARAIREVTSGEAPAIFKSFSASFPGDAIDESGFIRQVGEAVGAEQHFVEPTPGQFLEDLCAFTFQHDEPVGSLSVYAGFAVARLTRSHGVKVTLNGQGGDEVLGGYWQQYLMYLFAGLRAGRYWRVAGHLVGAVLPRGNGSLLREIPGIGSRYLSRRAASYGRGDEASWLGGTTRDDGPGRRLEHLRRLFLPRLLKWEDRNSMAFGVEGRYPFLDHELIELCLSFDEEILYRSGWVKWPLRLALQGRLPADVVWRRDKKGFEVPQRRWIRGLLAPLVHSRVGPGRPSWVATRSFLARGQEGDESLLARVQADEELSFRVMAFDTWMEVFGVAA
jgi:asparagine synthase (glutamine-hydrolysing)